MHYRFQPGSSKSAVLTSDVRLGWGMQSLWWFSLERLWAERELNADPVQNLEKTEVFKIRYWWKNAASSFAVLRRGDPSPIILIPAGSSSITGWLWSDQLGFIAEQRHSLLVVPLQVNFRPSAYLKGTLCLPHHHYVIQISCVALNECLAGLERPDWLCIDERGDRRSINVSQTSTSACYVVGNWCAGVTDKYSNQLNSTIYLTLSHIFAYLCIAQLKCRQMFCLLKLITLNEEMFLMQKKNGLV